MKYWETGDIYWHTKQKGWPPLTCHLKPKTRNDSMYHNLLIQTSAYISTGYRYLKLTWYACVKNKLIGQTKLDWESGVGCRRLWVFNIEHRLNLDIRAFKIDSRMNFESGHRFAKVCVDHKKVVHNGLIHLNASKYAKERLHIGVAKSWQLR